MRLLQPGQTVFLDAGSTTLILAEELVSLSGLTILTNGLEIATRMSAAGDVDRRNRIIVLGGDLLPGVPATCGAATVAEIQRYRADLALLSPVGVLTSYSIHYTKLYESKSLAPSSGCMPTGESRARSAR